jgi:hypothetical protein
LNIGLNVRDAFLTGVWPGEIAHLWLDDNGDSIGHPPDNLGDDGGFAYATTIGVPGSDNLELASWYSVWLHSAGELCVFDSQDRVTGLVNGELKEEIPNSVYDEFDEIVAVFAFDVYRYEVTGTEVGTYGLEIASIDSVQTDSFTAADIYTAPGVVHQYVVDWDALSRGEKGVTLQVDSDGDGTFEQTITSDQDLTKDEFVEEQCAAILNFFDVSVANKNLSGLGPGHSADRRRDALKNMIEQAGDYIENSLIEYACEQLHDTYNRCDGFSPPPDFVTGEATDDLATMVLYLRESLECE